jgi:uncharacterized membrane protein YcgQ (UPF0703/DUF1980 family)
MNLQQITCLWVFSIVIAVVWLVMWYLMQDPNPPATRYSAVAQIENSSHLLEKLKTVAICILVVLAVVQFKYAVAVKRADTVHVAAAYNFTKAVEQARARTITSDSLALDTASATINDETATRSDRRHALRVVNLVLSHALAYRDTKKAMIKLDSLLSTSWKF